MLRDWRVGHHPLRKPAVDLELEGKTAIVTGGSRGIGKVVARELAPSECDVDNRGVSQGLTPPNNFKRRKK